MTGGKHPTDTISAIADDLSADACPQATATPPHNPWVDDDDRLPAQSKGWPKPSKEGRRARKAVERALRSGRLVRGDCEYRMQGCVVVPCEAHHLSYDRGRELDVRWVCSVCHRKLTRRARGPGSGPAWPTRRR